ncbi:MAG: hypothetical protein RIQ81_2560 [Pseudomonadota bacterium]|jgi:hypothetical protein
MSPPFVAEVTHLTRLFTTARLLTIAVCLCSITPAGCKSRNNVSRLQAGDGAAGDLAKQCRDILAENQGQATIYSEEAIYRGLFTATSRNRLPLDKAADRFASRIAEDFLHFSGLVYDRKYGPKNYRTSQFADGFRWLVRGYVSLLGPSYYGTLEGQNAGMDSMLQNNIMGLLVYAMRNGGEIAYELQAGRYLKGLQANRGVNLPDLMVLFMMDQYKELFHLEDIAASHRDADAPAAIFSNKTTPAVACNNHAAQVIAEPIPWEKLGMDTYTGYGFVPWFHEPIARFRYEYPVISSIIPVLGPSLSAADSLISAVEGRDARGNNVSRVASSAFFTFHFTMAVLDAFSVKSAVQSSRDFVARVSNRARGLQPTAAGVEELTAVVKDEAMMAESAAKPLLGRNLNPCNLSAFNWEWLFSGIAYAGGLPCLKGLGEVNALHTNINNAKRLDVIKDVRIADVMSAPGHQYLRDPKKVISMSEHILKTGGAGFEAEPMIVNIFTNSLEDGTVAVRSVEVIDGNHRFAAGLLSGKWQKLGDIPEAFIKVKVNGWSAGGGFSEPRWIPLEIAEKSTISRQSWFRVPEHWANVKGPTAQIPGDIASIDPVIPLDYRGVRMEQVLRTSLERIGAGNMFPAR